MATQTAEFTADDAGCYFDGARGYMDVSESVQGLATSYGWDGEMHVNALFYSEATDEAVDYLNSLPMPADYSWAWNDGDFGFYHSCIDAYTLSGSPCNSVCPQSWS